MGTLFVKILDENLIASLDNYDKNAGDIISNRIMTPNIPASRPRNGSKFMGSLKRRLGGYEFPPNGVTQLWEYVEKKWNEIDGQVCQNIIESMSRHVEAMIKAKVNAVDFLIMHNVMMHNSLNA